MEKKGTSFQIIIDIVSFSVVVIFANYMEWTAKDLLWSLWISSLVIGYSTLLLGLGGSLMRGRMLDDQQSQNENKTGKIPLIGVLFTGVFLLVFFTIHFGGFHFVHSIFLNGMFPILNETPFGKTPGQTGFFFFDLIEVSFSNYWLFVVASAASSFESIVKTVKGREINFMMEPYKNVVKMHLMIFVIAFAGMAGFHNFILYAVLILYFFPVGKIIKDFKGNSKTEQS